MKLIGARTQEDAGGRYNRALRPRLSTLGVRSGGPRKKANAPRPPQQLGSLAAERIPGATMSLSAARRQARPGYAWLRCQASQRLAALAPRVTSNEPIGEANFLTGRRGRQSWSKLALCNYQHFWTGRTCGTLQDSIDSRWLLGERPV